MNNNTTRFEKLEYLLETCSSEHIKDCIFLQEIVRWMGDRDFNEFYERHCNLWEILQPEELEEAMR